MSEIIGQVSNLCLSPSEVAMGGVESHRQFLDEVAVAAYEGDAGYDGGYEITPTRALAASIRFNQYTESEAVRGLYSSVHQGWAEGGKYAVAMQRTHGSLKTIERLGHGRMDAVVFGDARHKGDPVNFGEYAFGSRGVQISPEVFSDWGIDPVASDYDAMAGHMAKRGLDRIVVDPFHLYRSHRSKRMRIDPEKVLDTADNAKIPIDRVHLRAGNGDLGDDDDKRHTAQDLTALIKSPEALSKSRMGELLLGAYDIFLLSSAGPDARFHFVTEVTEAGLRLYHERVQEDRKANRLPVLPFTQAARAQYHAAMASNTRQMLRNHA